MNKTIIKLTQFITILLLLSACEYQRENDLPEAGTSDSLAFALTTAVNEQMLTAVTNFKQQASNLNDQSTAFCNSVTSNQLNQLQTNWKQLALAWGHLEPYYFGPLKVDFFQTITFINSFRPKGVNYTSSARGNLASVISNSPTLSDAYFDNLNFNQVGLVALEVLIFESTIGTHSTETADIVSDFSTTANKCDYLKGMSNLLLRHANKIDNGWNVKYTNNEKPFKTLMLEETFDDDSVPVSVLIAAIQEHFDYTKQRKVGSGGNLNSQISNYPYEQILASIEEIEQLMEGKTDDSFSFFKHMQRSNFTDEVTLIRANIKTAKTAASNKNKTALNTAIGLLDGNFKRDIPTALNVTLSLNFTDGD